MSKKAKDSGMYLAIVFFSMFILVTSFLVWMFFKGGYVRQNIPVFPKVVEIAANGEYVYTLDNNNVICKYNNDGTLIWIRGYQSDGTNYIFCDEDGNLCRYETRPNEIYVYGEDGSVSESYHSTEDELSARGIELGAKSVQTSQDVSYEFKDKFLILSVGRYSREKSQDTLLKAIRYSKYKDKIQIILAGQGVKERYYKKLAKKLMKLMLY